MKHKQKKTQEQFYSPKTKPELINVPEEPEKTNESTNDDPRDGEESPSELQERDVTESDSSKLARRHAVNYARSLLLF